MPTIVRGEKRVRANHGSQFSRRPSASLTDRRRSAAVTAADHAIAGGWVPELGEVLDALGLRGAS